MALRAVGDDEKPQVKKQKTVAQAAKSGTQRELLVAMRNQVAETISTGCQPRDLAALTLRLIAPDHPLLVGVECGDDDFDASAI